MKYTVEEMVNLNRRQVERVFINRDGYITLDGVFTATELLTIVKSIAEFDNEVR